MKATRKARLADEQKKITADHVWTAGESFMLKIINDFLKGALANLQHRLSHKDYLGIKEASEEFAVKTLKRELKARAISFDDAIKDHKQIGNIVIQLIGYKKSIIQRTQRFIAKECPSVTEPDAEISEAANVGFMLRHLQIDDSDVIKWTGKVKISPAARRAFDLAISRKNPAAWKNPDLDLWLILVWPLVTAENWNYATVHYLAGMKFPELNCKPLETADAMGAHCKLTLGLKIQNKKAGRPVNDIFDLENPSPLHQFAIEIDANLPDFFQIENMGK